MSKSHRIDRRGFLKVAAGATAGAAAGVAGFPYFVPSSALGKDGAVAPSERITMGIIGTGGRGWSLVVNFIALRNTQILAVCNVKAPRRKNARKTVNQRYGTSSCEAYADLRELCARDDLDAVAVATTDHWHVPAALWAVRAGKDVYVEKPLGLSLAQGQALRRAVHRYGQVFQFGTQERSAWSTRFACETVLNGRIGKVHTIKVGSRYSRAAENYPTMPVPDWLDYDLWLGPAPWAPYTANRVINNWWFHISDYALGFLAGCGVHTVNMAQWGNGTQLTGPVEVEGTGEFPADGLCDCATGWDVNMKFANGVTMNFTDGKRNPLGVLFQGSEGWVFVKERHLGGTIDTHPKSLLRKKLGPNDIHLPVSNNHQQNFLDCVKTRAETVAPIDVAVRSDTICQLTDIASRLRRKLRWDPDREDFVGDAEASRMLTRAMRDPWRL